MSLSPINLTQCGYKALDKKALLEMTPRHHHDDVKKNSKNFHLRASGWRWFPFPPSPLGMKWSWSFPNIRRSQKYCDSTNADASDPAHAKYRPLMEMDRNQISRNQTIAGARPSARRTVSFHLSYPRIRGEFATFDSFRAAGGSNEAYSRNYLGKNHSGPGSIF